MMVKLCISHRSLPWSTLYAIWSKHREKIQFSELLGAHLDYIILFCNEKSHCILTGDFNDRTNEWHSSHSESDLRLDLYDLANDILCKNFS